MTNKENLNEKMGNETDHDTHDENCSCGLHHHEHHIHDEHCNCGEHHHEHSHKHIENGRVEITHHEGAVIGTFEETVDGYNDQILRDNLIEAAENLVKKLKALGCLIGHVKGFVKAKGRVISFSSVGQEMNIKSGEAQCEEGKIHLCLVLILFGINEEALRDEMEKALSVVV